MSVLSRDRLMRLERRNPHYAQLRLNLTNAAECWSQAIGEFGVDSWEERAAYKGVLDAQQAHDAYVADLARTAKRRRTIPAHLRHGAAR